MIPEATPAPGMVLTFAAALLRRPPDPQSLAALSFVMAFAVLGAMVIRRYFGGRGLDHATHLQRRLDDPDDDAGLLTVLGMAIVFALFMGGGLALALIARRGS